MPEDRQPKASHAEENMGCEWLENISIVSECVGECTSERECREFEGGLNKLCSYIYAAKM